MVRRKRLAALVLTLLIGLPFAASGTEKTPLARVEVQSTRVDWLPQEAQKSLELRIAGPGNLYIEKRFPAGETPSFDALDRQLPDGVYTYELRAAEGVVQTGSLWVQDGRFVEPEAQEAKPPLRNVTAQTTTVIPDDLVVQGQACIGADCLSTDVNGAALRIKETNNYQIKFDALNCCLPWEVPWVLQANEPGLSGDFLIRGFGMSNPFRINAYAPDNSFSIFANGNIGLGTLTPATRLDIKANATGLATERLQNSSATGYSGTEYLDNAGNVDLFFGVDNAASTTRLNSANNNPIVILTNGAERLRITPSLIYVPSGEVRIPGGSASANGWPTHFNWPLDGKNYIRGTTVIADDGGSVGIGTQAPTQKLHVVGNDTATGALIENTGTATSRLMLQLKNNGGVQLNYIDTSTSATWGTNAISGNFRIVKAGSGVTAVDVQGNGNVTIAGTLTQNSDRDTKHDIVPVQPEEILGKVLNLPIATWVRNGDEARHLGPMAQDFSAAFGLGEDERHIATLDMAGVSMASIQALHGKMTTALTQKDAEIESLKRENSELAKRLETLERLVSSSLRGTPPALPSP